MRRAHTLARYLLKGPNHRVIVYDCNGEVAFIRKIKLLKPPSISYTQSCIAKDGNKLVRVTTKVKPFARIFLTP